MKRIVIAVLAAFFCSRGVAEDLCRADVCAMHFELQSVSDAKSYGLLIEAPEAGCRKVRYVVRDAAAGFLGHTPALEPGDIAVVRMGRGFAAGDHDLTVKAKGCGLRPAVTRRVTLGKPSPDRGWRASAVAARAELVSDR